MVSLVTVLVLQACSASLFCKLVLQACSEEKPKDEYKFIEYLKVEGTCYENHVREAGGYSGDLVHWYNETKDQHSRYGSVHLSDFLVPEKMVEKIKNPYKYYLPFTVSFGGISQVKYSQSEMRLEGISEHTSKGESKEGMKCEATCTLSVTERLDYLPSLQSNDNDSKR
ncbi:hypothetical protein KQ302_07435 [Synechococcus sp. CS-602]|nr:hypothetical protein [Synechococcus sp. CS-602]MCT0244757.1 hypothetical protein [Synechococcus sp. CS-601]TWB91453.1 hypothetical protein FB106_10773 [Synechococcus sp. Ace-Pa]